MEPETFKQFSAMPDEQLFGYVTEKDSSQNKHVAMHLLDIRRNEPLRRASTET